LGTLVAFDGMTNGPAVPNIDDRDGGKAQCLRSGHVIRLSLSKGADIDNEFFQKQKFIYPAWGQGRLTGKAGGTHRAKSPGIT
jgi:hypothetical protein